MRLFVSVDIDELAPAIADIQEPLTGLSGIRTTDPEQAHLTLKFLGNTEEDRLPAVSDAIERALAECNVDPFRAKFGSLGVFPEFDYISVIWLGVRDGGDQLVRLHEAIEDRTVALGYNPEEHQFTPHVTLARMDHADSKAEVQEFVRTRDPIAGKTTINEVCLTESILTADGPVYETVESYPLDSSSEASE